MLFNAASSSQSSATRPSVAITGVLQLPGQHLAVQLARGDISVQLAPKPRGIYAQNVVNAQHPELQPVVQHLRTNGVNPIAVDMNQVSAIQHALATPQPVDYLVLVPPMSDPTLQPQMMMQQSERIVQAAKNAGVRNLIVLSWIGADARPDRKWLAAFEQIERQAKEAFGACTLVLRVGFPQQMLRLMAPDVREKQQLLLPIASAQIAPVDLDDVARCIACIMQNARDMPAAHRQQTYLLTGGSDSSNDVVSGTRIAELFSEIAPECGSGGGGGRVQYRGGDKSVASGDAAGKLAQNWRRMLQQMAAASTARGQPDIYAYPFEDAAGPFGVSDAAAALCFELCDLAVDNKLANTTQHVRQLTGQDPAPIERALRQFAVEFYGRSKLYT